MSDAEISGWYTIKCKPSELQRALADIQQSDDMRGNKIRHVDLIEEFYVIVFTRQFSYPFIINELRSRYPW